jgi:hypothetical protein
MIGGRQLDFFRASTVPTGWLSGVRASGGLTPHPIDVVLPVSGSRDALSEIVACSQPDFDPKSVRVLLTHHPIHAFDAGIFDRKFGPSAFANRKQVARELGRVPFHLAIAGHRHSLNPDLNKTVDGGDAKQPPLPRGFAQLVAESPTQEPVVFDDIDAAAPSDNSFSLYRIDIDEEQCSLGVERTLFRYRDSASEAFRAMPAETVIAHLGLE